MDIKDLVAEIMSAGPHSIERHGDIKVQVQGDLALCNYVKNDPFPGNWNEAEVLCRGLIINSKTGEVVARPFDKFFHWELSSPVGEVVEVLEKMDGSLGIGYRVRGEFRVATRGSFTGAQALWATDFLKQHYDMRRWPNNLTPLWEIIYPDNRVVIDYQGYEGLVLIGVRDRFTGQDYYHAEFQALADEFGFDVPLVYQPGRDYLRLAQELDGDQEGWVLRYRNGVRYKIKGERYQEIHRLIHGISYKRVVERMAEGQLDEYICDLPDEFAEVAREWQRDIQEYVDTVYRQCQDALNDAPQGPRKDFALWAIQYHSDIQHYLFALRDGKDITGMVCKSMRYERNNN